MGKHQPALSAIDMTRGWSLLDRRIRAGGNPANLPGFCIHRVGAGSCDARLQHPPYSHGQEGSNGDSRHGYSAASKSNVA